MEVNKIQEELARLIELVDGWAGSHDVPGIERDLVLDKLKKLYEAIRFANFDEGDSSASASVAAQQSVAEVAPVSEISIDLDDLLAELSAISCRSRLRCPKLWMHPSGSLRLCRNLRLPRSRFQCLPLQNLCRNRCLLLLPLLYPSRIRRLPSELPLNPCLYRNLYRCAVCSCIGACGRRGVAVCGGRFFAAGRFDGRAGRQAPEPGAMLRLGSVRRGLPDRLPDRWLPPPLKPIPNRSRKSSCRTVCSIWTIW